MAARDHFQPVRAPALAEDDRDPLAQSRHRQRHDISRIVEDNPGKSRFELRDNVELVGWAEYRPAGENVIVAHSEIDERREGEGLRSELVRGVLDHTRASGKTVIPLCPFTAAYIQRHSEYVDLVDPSVRGRFVPST